MFEISCLEKVDVKLEIDEKIKLAHLLPRLSFNYGLKKSLTWNLTFPVLNKYT